MATKPRFSTLTKEIEALKQEHERLFCELMQSIVEGLQEKLDQSVRFEPSNSRPYAGKLIIGEYLIHAGVHYTDKGLICDDTVMNFLYFVTEQDTPYYCQHQVPVELNCSVQKKVSLIVQDIITKLLPRIEVAKHQWDEQLKEAQKEHDDVLNNMQSISLADQQPNLILWQEPLPDSLGMVQNRRGQMQGFHNHKEHRIDITVQQETAGITIKCAPVWVIRDVVEFLLYLHRKGSIVEPTE